MEALVYQGPRQVVVNETATAAATWATSFCGSSPTFRREAERHKKSRRQRCGQNTHAAR
jgi:5'-3' exonuclease